MKKCKKRRILQVVPTLAFGDAVGNDAIALKNIIKNRGFKTEIYAVNIDDRLPAGSARRIDDLKRLKKEDIIFFHMAIGSDLSNWIMAQDCRKIMIYHNITPPDFWDGYNATTMGICKRGLEEVFMMKDTFELVLADSEFNKQNLIEMGYTCPIKVLPIMIAFDDYRKEPRESILKQYDDSYTNFIFVGRIAPNKKQEDIITAFYYYKKHYNQNARLILVGSDKGTERYSERLKNYVKELDLSDVTFTGHIKFDEILAFYRLADVFICASEHEGFCVPLVEAMFFDVPIVAYDSCAVKYTLGGSGFLLKNKDGMEMAGVLNRIVSDRRLSETIIENQRERLKFFLNENVEIMVEQILEEISAW